MPAKALDLLRYSPPYSDESLAGYLLRLAEKNHYQSPNWILQLAGLKANRGIDLSLNRKQPSRLSQLVKVNDEQLKMMATGAVVRFKQCRYVIYNYAQKLCPQCLKQALYCRRLWDDKHLKACPFHGCRLMQECPQCQQAIKWSRPGVSRCQCGFDFRDSQAAEASSYQVKLSLYLYGLDGHQDCQKAIQALYGADNPIFELTLSQFTRLSSFLGSLIRTYQRSQRCLALNKIILTDWEFKKENLSNCELILDFFEQWQDNFPHLLGWYECQLTTTGRLRKWLPEKVYFIVELSSYFSGHCPFSEYLCHYLVEFLKSQGIDQIEIVWLSHAQRRSKSLFLKDLESWLPSVAKEFYFPHLNLVQLIYSSQEAMWLFPSQLEPSGVMILRNPEPQLLEWKLRDWSW